MNQKQSYLINLLVVVIVISTLFYANPTAKVQADTVNDEYYFLRSWGGDAEQIRYPNAIGISPNNDIYVVNYGKMTLIHQPSRIFTAWPDFYQTSTLGVDLPENIAFDQFGNIFYADMYRDQVIKYLPDGTLLGALGERGSGNGQFIEPSGIAIDSGGFIYVSDMQNHRIQKFNTEMEYITQWTGEVFSSGYFSPYAAAIDSEDNLYVIDISNDCVQKFTSDGEFITAFGGEYLGHPSGIAINSQNKIYIVNMYDPEPIYIFNSDGELISHWSNGFGDLPGQFAYPESVAIDSADNVYISDTYNQRVQKFDSYGNYLTSWGESISTLGEFNSPEGMTIDDNNNILIADSRNNRIQKFTLDGTFIESWGLENQFNTPRDIASDEYGFYYVADHDWGRIQKLNSDGDIVDSWGFDFEKFPISIAINRDLEWVYVSENGTSKIVVYDYDGNFLFSWGSWGEEDGQFRAQTGITIDNLGYVYVLDPQNDRFQKFDANGQFVFSVYIELFDALDILADNSGNVFIVNTTNTRIEQFHSDGSFNCSWGSFGWGAGSFMRPAGITMDPQGNIYISDSVKNQIQVFGTELPDSDPYSGLIQNGDFVNGSSKWTIGGSLEISFPPVPAQDNLSMLLGEQVPQQSQGINQAWAYQTFYVDPSWARPTLSFKYNMYVNDIIDYSDFLVSIEDGVGLNHLATVIRDGFQPCIPRVAPAPGRNLGWRSVTYDLSAYKGQYIRVVFANRNLWPNSWGIWTYLDDVRVIDAGPLPPRSGFYLSFLPVINTYHCDAIY